MKSFIVRHKWALIFTIGVFIIPFFWFKPGEVDYGGDSTRLYFYDPFSWLKYIALYSVNPLDCLGGEMSNYLLVPLLAFLAIIKSVLSVFDYSLINIFNGLLLSGGFFSVYLISQELLKSLFAEEIGEKKMSVFPSIIAGLFFIFSPLLIYDWERALYSISQMAAYPPIFYFFLKFINTKKWKYLFLSPSIFFLFSVNFSYATVPCVLAFAIFSFIFFLFYSILFKKVKIFIYGSLVLSALFVLINSFDTIPQIFSLFSPAGMNYKLITGKTFLDNWGLNYFMSVVGSVHLFYNLLSQNQYSLYAGFGNMHSQEIFDYGINIIPVFLLYPIIITLGLLLADKFSIKTKKILILLFSVFLLCMYFITANITNFGFQVYKNFFKIPGFSMFRGFYGKFAMSFDFFYALLFAYCLSIVFIFIKKTAVKGFLIFGIIILILFEGWPLISGRIVNGVLWHSKNIKYSSAIDPDFIEMIKYLENDKQASKMFSLPLTTENYQILQGKNNKGVYFGPSAFSVLAGRNSFNGTGAFSVFWPQIQHSIETQNYSRIKKYFSLLNIGYIFWNKSDFIFDNFPDYPYSEWLKQIFPDQKAIGTFVDGLGLKKVYPIKDYYLYQNQSDFLPLFYIPKEIVYSSGSIEDFPQILDWYDSSNRLGLYFGGFDSKKYNNHFVFGESKDLEDLSLYDSIKNEGALYLTVQKVKDIPWRLKLLKEDYALLLLKGDKRKIIKQKILFNNMRIAEVISFRLREEDELKNYSKNLNDVMDLIIKVEDPKERFDFSLRLKSNLNDNFEKLHLVSISNISKWEEVINQSLLKIKILYPEISAVERKYQLDIPKEDNYSIYLKPPEKFKDNIDFLGKISSVKIADKNIYQTSAETNNLGWLKWGEAHLNGGVLKMKVNYDQSINLLMENDWQVYMPTEDMATRSSIMIDEFELPKAKKYYYKNINRWEKENWYHLTVKINEEKQPKFNLVIGERYLSEELINGEKNTVIKLRTTKNYLLGPGNPVLDYNFLTGKDVISANVFLIGDESLETTDGEDLFLGGIYQPDVLLKPVSSENVIDEKEPKITFVKINSTKYRVRVEGATSPYDLIFSESYHNGWKVYLSNNLVDFGVITQSYFDGDIKEGFHKNIFLEPATFETWGKESIAKNSHVMVNGYANSWHITPEDVGNKKDYELIIEFWPQRLFYIGLLVSGTTLLTSLLFVAISFIRKQKNEK